MCEKEINENELKSIKCITQKNKVKFMLVRLRFKFKKMNTHMIKYSMNIRNNNKFIKIALKIWWRSFYKGKGVLFIHQV